MSECNCGKQDCATCCVDCNTGWIQADLREGAANFRATSTDAANNAQDAIRDVNLSKSQLAELMSRGFSAGALAEANTQSTVQTTSSHTQSIVQTTACHTDAIVNATACKTEAAVHATASRTDTIVRETSFAVEKRLLECCCEIKATVIADGQKTRDLITANQIQALRDANATSQATLAAYFAAKVPPVVPTV